MVEGAVALANARHTKLVLTTFRLCSDNVLTTFCSERDGHQNVLGRFKVLDILACSGSSYYVQVVRTVGSRSEEYSKNEFGVTEV